MSPNMDHHVVLIKEDFNVLNKVIARQVEIIQQLLSGVVEPDAYEHIEMNETIIDSLEVKIRSEVINGIILYTPCLLYTSPAEQSSLPDPCGRVPRLYHFGRGHHRFL